MAGLPQLLLCAAALSLLATVCAADGVDKLQVESTFTPENCDKKAHNGDKVKVHYKGMLMGGTVFDSSYNRRRPFDFTLGQGKVIKGWDLGILGMCEGEKRKLTIPSHLAYGDRGFPPKIPAKATLVFETEMVKILGGSDD